MSDLHKAIAIKQIESAYVGDVIRLPDNNALEYVQFDSRKYDKEYIEYSWVGERRATGTYVRPIDGDYIATFKTLKGAKRNFMRSYFGRQLEKEAQP